MATVNFTSNLKRHLDCPPRTVHAETVRQALDQVFVDNKRLAGYILDDQSRLRKHVTIFVDGRMIKDRQSLGDRLSPDSEIYVMQALSGG